MTFNETMVVGGLILSLAIIIPFTIIAIFHLRNLLRIREKIRRLDEDWDRRRREAGMT